MGLVGVGMVTIDERYNLPQLEKGRFTQQDCRKNDGNVVVQ